MRDLIEHAVRFHFFTGKGGVGKTSLACATAVGLADPGGERGSDGVRVAAVAVELIVKESMDDMWTRIVTDLLDRVSGPMKFRLVLQPIMASIFAIKAGLHDTRADRPPYFWSLFTDPGHRADMLKDGWKSVGKVFVLALVLDVVYQIIVMRFVYPGEALITAVLLTIVPYLLLRGLITRFTRRS